MHRFLACAILLFAAPIHAADDRYFLLVFGAERPSRSPDHAHTFATFVKRSETAEGARLEVRTISWLPAKLPVRTLKIRPEAGHNYELHETIRFLQGDGQRVSVWGPYEIRPELYEMAGCQIARLNSGAIRYKSYDGLFHSARVTNCIHALSSMVEGDRRRVFGPGWGDVSSYHVTGLFLPWVVDRCTTYDTLVKELCLEQYCLAYRKTFAAPAASPRIGLQRRDPNPVLTAGPPPVRGRSPRR